jgi:hypothetical protein
MFLWSWWHPARAYARSGFLVDIYTLIDECQHTSRDDFFTQALTAYEMDGGLYLFPLSFGFKYISINANLPQSAIDRFTQLSAISMRQLFELYHEIIAEYGNEFGHLNFLQDMDMIIMRSGILNGFVDFDTRASNLMDEDFISLLEHWAPLDPWDDIGFFTMIITHPANSIARLQDLAGNYMFMVDTASLNPSYAFLTPAEVHFKHHIPLTDEAGRLLINNSPGVYNPNWATVCITTVGDSALAWEFTRYLIATYSQPAHMVEGRWGHNSFASPILRSLYERHISRALESFAMPSGPAARRVWRVAAQEPDELMREINNVLPRLAAYNEMPLVLMDALIPYSLHNYTLNYLSLGLITAADAAQQLHNSITLWLME